VTIVVQIILILFLFALKMSIFSTLNSHN